METGTAIPKRNLSQVEVLAQSIALTAPSGIIAVVMPLIAPISGPDQWLVWLIGGIMVTAVGFAVALLSRRYVTSGGLYALATKAAGSAFGLVSSWMIVVFVLISILGSALITGLVTAPALHSLIGLPGGTTATIVYMFLTLAVAAVLSYLGVALSLKVMLAIEGLTLVVVAILLIGGLVHHHGSVFESSQLHLGGIHLGSAILPATVFVFYSFAGWESSSVLGLEAKNPKRAIPIAIVGSAIFVSLLFVVSSYILTLSVGPTRLASSTNALTSLAHSSGLGWMANIIGVGVALSLFNGTLALVTETGHTVYTLGRERLLPRQFARIDRMRETPVTALAVSAGIVLILLIILVAAGVANQTWYGYVSTLSGYCIIVPYTLVSIAAMYSLWRERELSVRAGVVVLVAIVAPVYVLYKSAVPIPPWPLNLVLYIFVGVVVAAVGVYVGLRSARPEVLTRFASSVDGDTVRADDAEGSDASEAVAVPTHNG
jgi:amino acid transporter